MELCCNELRKIGSGCMDKVWCKTLFSGVKFEMLIRYTSENNE